MTKLFDFTVGDKVYVKDDEYDIWDGEVLLINPDIQAAFVIYGTQYYLKHRWVSFEELHETMTEARGE